MKEIKIKISDKSYNVKLAETDEQKEIGLMNVKELPENEGMLFVFDESDEVSIWMKDTLVPLDIIFINEDLTVINVQQGKPESEDFMTEQDVCLVLEVNQNSGIKRGDELEFSPESKTKLDKMIVLNEDGSPQMELEGGERIFSRYSTKILIKKAKKANSLQTDGTYISLGKYLFKELEAQDNRDPEYVELKN